MSREFDVVDAATQLRTDDAIRNALLGRAVAQNLQTGLIISELDPAKAAQMGIQPLPVPAPEQPKPGLGARIKGIYRQAREYVQRDRVYLATNIGAAALITVVGIGGGFSGKPATEGGTAYEDQPADGDVSIGTIYYTPEAITTGDAVEDTGPRVSDYTDQSFLKNLQNPNKLAAWNLCAAEITAERDLANTTLAVSWESALADNGESAEYKDETPELQTYIHVLGKAAAIAEKTDVGCGKQGGKLKVVLPFAYTVEEYVRGTKTGALQDELDKVKHRDLGQNPPDAWVRQQAQDAGLLQAEIDMFKTLGVA